MKEPKDVTLFLLPSVYFSAGWIFLGVLSDVDFFKNPLPTIPLMTCPTIFDASIRPAGRFRLVTYAATVYLGDSAGKNAVAKQ